MDLNTIRKRKNINKIIVYSLCFLMVFSIVMKPVEAEANPALLALGPVLGPAGIVLLMTLLAGGYAIHEYNATKKIIADYEAQLDEQTINYINDNYESWESNGNIELPNEIYEDLINRQIASEYIINGKIKYITMPDFNYPITYITDTSLTLVNPNVIKNLYMIDIAKVNNRLWFSDYLSINNQNGTVYFEKYNDNNQMIYGNTSFDYFYQSHNDVPQLVGFVIYPNREIYKVCKLTYANHYPNGFFSHSLTYYMVNGEDYTASNQILNYINENNISHQSVITYNSYNPPVNNNKITIPLIPEITFEDIQGKSGEEIYQLSGGNGTIPEEGNESGYAGLLGTIIILLNNIKDKIVDTGSTIIGGISTAIGEAGNGIKALLNTIISALSGVFSWENNPFGKGIAPKIGAFFNPLLALLIAIMHLIAKIIIFIGNIANIPASSAMLHPSMIVGLNWARGFTTAGGVNLFGLIQGVISIVLGIVVFKQIRRIIAGIGTASYTEAREALIPDSYYKQFGGK